MKATFIFLFLVLLFSCQSSEEKHNAKIEIFSLTRIILCRIFVPDKKKKYSINSKKTISL